MRVALLLLAFAAAGCGTVFKHVKHGTITCSCSTVGCDCKHCQGSSTDCPCRATDAYPDGRVGDPDGG